VKGPGFKGQGIFLYPKAFRPSLGHTQPPFERLPEFFRGIYRSERKLKDSSFPSSEVNNARSYISTPSIHLHGVGR
jgi:hypothetical protein